MDKSDDFSFHPCAYEKNSYPWNLRRVPLKTSINGHIVPHPGRHSAIFVVHGMGEQEWLDTSVLLRSGFEDALEAIRLWQAKNLKKDTSIHEEVPPPYVRDGFWANYPDPDVTFPEDWKTFNKEEKKFFDHLWKKRSYSALRTISWFLSRQIQILFLPKVKPLSRLLYLPLQFILPLAWLLTLLRAPRIIARILADVRLYANPRGMSEKAIVQRIESRVGKEFLKLLGLDWDFKPLARNELVTASGKPFVFNRIIWVSHSLGSVVSYNVLSDIFRRAAEVELTGSAIQKKGAARFRKSLHRFVTLGSPLDKFAALFPDTMRPWPEPPKNGFLETKGDTFTKSQPPDGNTGKHGWWINFYHVLDPVSGSLENPIICNPYKPLNIHSDWKSIALIPGLAHSSYWEDDKVLRFMLARTYGKEYLYDEDIEFHTPGSQIWFAIAGYFIWASLLYGILISLIWFYKDIGIWLWKILF
jgi:hypothetical protein